MKKSANEVMQDILYAAVLDGIAALKAGSGGMPNALLRDIGAIHPNTAYADLPKELQAAIGTSVRNAFTRLLKEGYAVAPNDGSAPRPRPAGGSPTIVPRGVNRPPQGQRPGGARPSGPRPNNRPGGGGPGGNRGGPPKGPRGPR
jgi:hypothetical protein